MPHSFIAAAPLSPRADLMSSLVHVVLQRLPFLIRHRAVLLGEAGVGKTNLLTQFVKGEFIEGQESTIGGAPSSLNFLELF